MLVGFNYNLPFDDRFTMMSSVKLKQKQNKKENMENNNQNPAPAPSNINTEPVVEPQLTLNAPIQPETLSPTPPPEAPADINTPAGVPPPQTTTIEPETSSAVPQITQVADQPPQPKNKKWLMPATAAIVLLLLIGGAIFAYTKNHKKTDATPVKTANVTTQDKQSSSSGQGLATSQQDSLVKADSKALMAHIEAYSADTNGVYPGDISPSTFASQNPDPNIFTLPDGYKYAYTPAPSNCTTAAKNCKDYTLKSVRTSDNTVIDSESSNG